MTREDAEEAGYINDLLKRIDRFLEYSKEENADVEIKATYKSISGNKLSSTLPYFSCKDLTSSILATIEGYKEELEKELEAL